MRIRFVGQPFAEHRNLLDFIEHATTGQFDELRIAVAWAKKSGLGRIWDSLATFRAQGGRVVIILGVSEGGATREGLEIALEAADEAFVFHDPGRTFHPKVYLATSSGVCSLMVGSSNLTAGGLGWNHEASLWVDWGAGEHNDVIDAVSAWFEALISESGSCAPLTSALIDDIEKSKDIVLGSERRARRVQKTKSDAPEDTDSAVAATVSGLFSTVKAQLRKLPKLNAKFTVTKARPSIGGLLPTGATGNAGAARPRNVQEPVAGSDAPLLDVDIQRRWSKELDHTAAQQPKGAKTNPTGNLRLSREAAPINHKTYFREQFFEGLPWTPTEGHNTEQEAVAEFNVWIDGHDLGAVDLRLSHDPERVSGQGNVPTVIHWGRDLGEVLKRTNYIGQYVTLEKTMAGRFNLVIARNPRGDYLI
ncbi:phospholipase D family protein [Microbacterium plantarum]|uniref:phospholipase D family protein n=1 Tax=Microbacterium plantarum TaxID=1816425 RepID=UPI002B47AAE7|nr:phospholipase D family protein [Microbacterium plantarum]WRK17185.1 phospholipase D family protein [Microbacterium plantarum]